MNIWMKDRIEKYLVNHLHVSDIHLQIHINNFVSFGNANLDLFIFHGYSSHIFDHWLFDLATQSLNLQLLIILLKTQLGYCDVFGEIKLHVKIDKKSSWNQ